MTPVPTRVAVRLLAGLLRLLSRLPLAWLQAAGGLLGHFAFITRRRERVVCEANIRLCFPDCPPARQRRLVRRGLVQMGRGVAELATLWFADPGRLLGSLDEPVGIELLDRGVAGGRGVLIAAPHLGCWELTSHFATLRGYPLTALFRPPRQAALAELVHASRQRFGATLVPTTAGGVRALRRALQRGECVGILPDQDPGRGGRVMAPFFGIETGTMVLFGRLARSSEAELLLAWAERLPGGRFRLHISRLPEAVRDADDRAAASALNDAVEAAVRSCPEQYLWAYRRFKSRPPGTPPRYPRKRR